MSIKQLWGRVRDLTPKTLAQQEREALGRLDALISSFAEPVTHPEPADEQTPFDRAMTAYARATWHHDTAGMRAGYIALQRLRLAAEICAAERDDLHRAVAAERERCADIVRFWLAGWSPSANSYEGRCVAHIMDGSPAPSSTEDGRQS